MPPAVDVVVDTPVTLTINQLACRAGDLVAIEGDVVEVDLRDLRVAYATDRDALAEMFADPVHMEWYPSPFTLEQTQAWIDRQFERYENDGFGLFVADLLISDASSVSNEYALLDRPMVFLDVPKLLKTARGKGSMVDLDAADEADRAGLALQCRRGTDEPRHGRVAAGHSVSR